MSAKLKLIGAILLAIVLAGCAPDPNASNEFVTLPESPLLAFLEHKSGLIAYVGTDGNVYVVDQGGLSPLQLTTDAQIEQGKPFRFYQFPVWSPDGASVAFHSFSGTDQTDVKSSVYTVGSDGKNLVEAYTSDSQLPIYLSWSPNSKEISFIASLSGGTGGLVLNMVPAAGGETKAVDVGGPYYWDWQPDSTGMFIHSGGATSDNPSARLSLLTTNEGVVEDGFSLPSAAFKTPEFSPDGSQVLLAVRKDGKNELVTTDRAGEVQKEIATFDNDIAFSWSPDGKRIAFIAGNGKIQATSGKLNFVELGDTLTTTTPVEEDVLAFFWSPDSKKVAYFVPMQEGTGQDAQFALILHVVEVTSGEIKELGQFGPTEDFLQAIVYFDQYARSSTIWSPDSENIVVAISTQQGPGIFVVPALGGIQPRFLISGSMAFWSWK